MNGNRGVFVCMVAYTDYVGDARVRREAETLAAHGFHVRCICLTTSTTSTVPFVLEGVEVRAVPVLKYRGKSTLAYVASYLRFLMSSSVECMRVMARGELDVVHVHNIPDFLVFAGLLPRLAGRKVVLDVHDSVPETFATKFPGRAIFWSMLCLQEGISARLAHKVICVNHPQRDTLVARGVSGPKTFVSMNVPDPRIFVRPPSTAVQPVRHSGDLNLIYHGTMAGRLGVDLVIRAVAQLQDRVPNARLHLWGHGDDLPAFQRLAAELKIQDRVLFQPNGFPLQDLAVKLRPMDIGVVGNRRTAACDLMLPVKLLEYVALDIPVVVPRLKTIEHYFSSDMVAYYEPDDVESLADAIYRLFRNPSLRTGQAAAARAFLGRYGWERQGAELVSFYRSLLEN